MAGAFSAHHLNVQRVSNREKFDRIRDYVNRFRKKPTIFGIVETWILRNETGEKGDSNTPINLYRLEGYETEYCSRDNRSGGIAVYFEEGLRYEMVDKDNGAVSYVHARVCSDLEFFVTYMYMPRLSDYRLITD